MNTGSKTPPFGVQTPSNGLFWYPQYFAICHILLYVYSLNIIDTNKDFTCLGSQVVKGLEWKVKSPQLKSR